MASVILERLDTVGEAVAAFAVATLLVAAAEVGLAVDNGSPIYLLAVAFVAVRRGTKAAVGVAIASFLGYNLLFVPPRFTLTVEHADELVTLILLLFIGVLIGRLAGQQREREQLAGRREREARALFAVTRELATARDASEAMQAVVLRLRDEGGFRRVWVGIGATSAIERPAADTDAGQPLPTIGTHFVLGRDRSEDASTWVRVHPEAGARRRAARGDHQADFFRVGIGVEDERFGSLWGERSAGRDVPYLEQTRLLAATADQLAQVIRRERLAAVAAEIEIAQRTDELRSALLDSVSHDLRTPLASIRAAAGTLADPSMVLDDDERRATARSIDRQAEGLNALVGSLLDMSRIQSGSLVPELEVMPIEALLEPALERASPRMGSRSVTVSVPESVATVRVDPTFLTQAITNVLDNAIRYTPDGARIDVTVGPGRDNTVRLTIEDGGPGVPDDALPRLFERFYRVGATGAASRRGFGLGLSVARGLVEASGGSLDAERSRLGGLAVVFELAADTDANGASAE